MDQDGKARAGVFSGCWRGVVGVIKPTYRPGSLEEFIRLLPEGIGVIPKFAGIKEGLEKEFVDAFAAAEKMIEELAEMKVDLIHPEGAPLFVQKGYTRSGEIVSELERKYSIPIVTSGMILVEAARALGIKNCSCSVHSMMAGARIDWKNTGAISPMPAFRCRPSKDSRWRLRKSAAYLRTRPTLSHAIST